MNIEDRMRVYEEKRSLRVSVVSVIVGLAMLGLWQLAEAQTAVPAYADGGLAWNYPDNVVGHAGFRLNVDGVTGKTDIPKAARQILLKDTILKGQPLGKPYTIKLVATATAPAKESAPATLLIQYQANPVLMSPTSVRTILEWAQ